MTPYFLLCHKKLPQTSWFKKTQIYYLAVLWVRSLTRVSLGEIEVSAGLRFILEALGETLLFPSMPASRGHLHFLAPRSLCPIFKTRNSKLSSFHDWISFASSISVRCRRGKGEFLCFQGLV